MYLPPIASLLPGDWIEVNDIDFNASAHTITIHGNGSELIYVDTTSANVQPLNLDGVRAFLVVNAGTWRMFLSVNEQPSLSLQASANLTAPALVNVTASFKVAYADATAGLQADGFITESVVTNAYVTMFTSGILAGLSGLVPGPVFLLPGTPGGVTQTSPASGSGFYSQQVGFAISSSSMVFSLGQFNGPL